MPKTLDQYSAEDLKSLVDSIATLPGAMKAKAKTLIKDGEFNGTMWAALESAADLEAFGFVKFVSQQIWKKLETIPRKNENSDADNLINNLLDEGQHELDNREDETDDSNNEDGFRVTFTQKDNSCKKTKDRFTPDSLVSDLVRYLIDCEFGGRKGKLSLHSKAIPIKHTNTFKQAGITKESIIQMAFKVGGGSALGDDEKQSNENKQPRKRIAHFKQEKRIQPTLLPDCIMGDNDRKSLRVQMPCKHVFTPNTIFRICKMTIERHSRTDFRCPIPKCNQKWEFDIVVAAADLSLKERCNFISILSNRKLVKTGDFRQCKGCNGVMSKPDDLTMFRVRCIAKSCASRRDFCWQCGNDWNKGGMTVCGNKDCQTAYINETLKNCGFTKTMLGREGEEIPLMRACPRCLTYVHYDSACKHMKCWGCRKDFCFVCLALGDKSTGKWTCATGDGYSGKCVKANIQQL